MMPSVFCAAAYGLDLRERDTCFCGPEKGQQVTRNGVQVRSAKSFLCVSTMWGRTGLTFYDLIYL